MRILLALAGLLLMVTAQAEPTRYITDQFEVTLRTGASLQNSILKMLPSGTPVELLNTDADSGYSQIRTQDGVEGWIITRYLMDTPSARSQLDTLHKDLGAAQSKIQELSARIATLQSQNKGVEQARAQLQSKSQNLTEELASIRRTAGNALQIDQERQQLKQYVRTLERDLQTLRTENESLKDRSARDWFTVGAGVLLVGILTGGMLARMRSRRRDSWEGL